MLVFVRVGRVAMTPRLTYHVGFYRSIPTLVDQLSARARAYLRNPPGSSTYSTVGLSEMRSGEH